MLTALSPSKGMVEGPHCGENFIALFLQPADNVSPARYRGTAKWMLVNRAVTAASNARTTNLCRTAIVGEIRIG